MDEEIEGLASEARHAGAAELDRLPTAELMALMNREDASVPRAVERVLPEVARLVDAVAERLRRGGRLLYAGAGTSGRLGVLDAVECPPTFGVDARLVQGVIAGGEPALLVAVEGAEDDVAAGRRDLEARGVGARDAVVALAASGRTPWCRGALEAARERGALTALVTVNPEAALAPLADCVVAPRVGPEILSGSTRLKAGTAQKLVLNMLSTGVMVRLGRVHGGLMVGVQPTNEKLRVRARGLVREICSAPEAQAQRALEACEWDVRVACVHLRCGLDPEAARARLEAAGGVLRKALEDG